jgi:formylglycine-generating enzyme required for sulfatase activity
MALAMTAVAACQVVSGIANLDIVDDAGDARANDATAEASGQGDAQNDSAGDSTVEAGSDGTTDSQADAAVDAPLGLDGGSEGPADAEAGSDAAGEASTNDAGDSGGGSSDAGDASDATDATDATDASDAGGGPVDGGCQFGWQCPAGYCGAGGVCAEPPSCVGMAPTCGPNGTDDCCKSVAVMTPDSGATFLRSFDGPNYMDASSPATMAGPFALDKYEVTVERFETFISGYTVPTTGSGNYPPVGGTGWNASWPFPASQAALLSAVSTSGGNCPQPFTPSTGLPPSTAHLPVNCVDWYLAFAFCAWDGSRLPTEAEWNFAAAGGGGQQRMYPWLSGSMPPPTIDSTYAWYDCSGGMGTMEPGGGPGPCTLSQSLPVGSESPKGDTMLGHADMAGSMLEPTIDFFGTYPVPCTNCVDTNPASGQRAYRGGSWMDPPANLDDGYRSGVAPTSGAGNTGIRCAR